MTTPELDSSAGRARVLHTAREVRHRIRNDLGMIMASSGLLKNPAFARDAEAIQAIGIAVDRLIIDTDELYAIATGGRARWWSRLGRWLLG
jgi:hypothetical protein